MLKIAKIKPKQTETIQSTRQRLYRFAFVVFLAWCSLQFLPKPNDYPAPRLEKMEFFQASQLGDTSIFNLLEELVETKAKYIYKRTQYPINIDDYISKLKENLKIDYEKIYEPNIQKMKADILENLVHYIEKIFNIHNSENQFVRFLSWLLNQTAQFIHILIHSKSMELFRAFIDPTLPFLHATLDQNYYLDYLESSQGKQRNENFYIKTRLPEALEQEVKKTWQELQSIETQLESLDKEYKTGNLEQTRFSNFNDQFNQKIDSLLTAHRIKMNSEVILWINSANDQFTMYEWQWLKGKLQYTCPLSPPKSRKFEKPLLSSPGSEDGIVDSFQCHSTVNDSFYWVLLKFSQLLDRGMILFSHLVFDEFIFEILVLYFIFSLTIVRDSFNSDKGKLFIVLYQKARWTTCLNKKLNNFTRNLDALNYCLNDILLELKQCSFSEFQQYYTNSKMRIKSSIKDYLSSFIHHLKNEREYLSISLEEGSNSFDKLVAPLKLVCNLAIELITQPFRFLFSDKPSNPRSSFDRFFRDIRICRDQILSLKMALQYPYFLHEHHSIELAYDVLVDGLPPNLDKHFNQGEDAKRFINQYQTLARNLTSLNMENLCFYLNQRSILLDGLASIETTEKNILEERLNFINEELPVGATANNGDVATDIRHDIEVFAKQVSILSELINVFEIHYDCVTWSVKTNLLDLEQIDYRDPLSNKDPYSKFIEKKIYIHLSFYILVLLTATCLLIEKLVEKFEKETDSYHASSGWSILLENSEDIIKAKRSRILNEYLDQGMLYEDANTLTQQKIDDLVKAAIKREGKEYIPSKAIVNNFRTLEDYISSTMNLPEDVQISLRNLFQLMTYLKLKPIHFCKQYQRIWGYCYINESVIPESDLFKENFSAVIQPSLINFFVHLRPRILVYKVRREDVLGTITNFLLSHDIDILFNHFNSHHFASAQEPGNLSDMPINTSNLSQELAALLPTLHKVKLAQVPGGEEENLSQVIPR
jgi:hypothetical protein